MKKKLFSSFSFILGTTSLYTILCGGLLLLLVVQLNRPKPSILEKFYLFNQSFERSVYKRSEINEKRLTRMRSIVQESGASSDSVQMLERAINIRKQAATQVAYIKQLKATLITMTGGSDAEGKPYGLTNEASIAAYMLQQGKGQELQDCLNAYAHAVATVTLQPYRPLAGNAYEDPTYQPGPDDMGKDFTTLHFEKTPLCTALLTLSRLASEVLHLEAEALETLARKAGFLEQMYLKKTAHQHTSAKVAVTMHDKVLKDDDIKLHYTNFVADERM